MSRPVPGAFRGMRWEPTDEQEVVMLFGRLLDYLPKPLAIEFVRTGFPDCRATDSQTGRDIWIEFELKSSHFYRDHADRLEKCDWIVCWQDDDRRAPQPGVPIVVALSDIVRDHALDLILNSQVALTQPEAFHSRIASLSPHSQKVIERLLHFGETDLTVEWPETNGACFTVRGPIGDRNDVEYFKVACNGMIGIPFSRWNRVPPVVMAEVVASLNSALNTSWFTGQGKTSRDVADLIQDEGSAERFISVWRRLSVPRGT